MPVWVIGFFALLVVVLLGVAAARSGSLRNLGFFGQAAALAFLVGLAFLYLDRLGEQDRADYHRHIETRLAALTALSLQPNSALACLHAASGDLMQEACEKALYAGPEQVAAALTYAGARLDILRDIAALPAKQEAAYDVLRAPLLAAAQADRYGFVAQVLQSRDGCLPDKCPAFEFLKRYEQIAANMRERAYEARLTKYASGWSDKPAPAVAAAPPPPAAPAPAKESQLDLDFPSSASIPPVSIMANEPGLPAQNGVDAKAEAKPAVAAAPASAKRPQSKATSQPKQPPQAAVAQEPQANPFPQPVPANGRP